jgi:acetyltransferase-like isoleucine patch superfamily enzyme
LNGRGGIGRATTRTYRLTVRARNKLFSLLAAGSFDSFGARSVVQLPVRLQGEERMAIGNGVFVGAGCWLQVLEGESDGVALRLEDDVAIAGYCVLSAAKSIRLGRHVSLARNVYIADHSHAYDDPERPMSEQGVTQVEPVVVEDGAWLGENVVVLPGVRIGRGSVVAANSVVAKDVPDFSLAIGSPARVVRRFGPKPAPEPSPEPARVDS